MTSIKSVDYIERLWTFQCLNTKLFLLTATYRVHSGELFCDARD